MGREVYQDSEGKRNGVSQGLIRKINLQGNQEY
jgi:hypothetical protein